MSRRSRSAPKAGGRDGACAGLRLAHLLNRLIVTGPNGAGKSHLARRLAELRPDVPLVSYDALRLTRNWVKRPEADSAAALVQTVATPHWILEGGPSLLPIALARAEGVVWLSPPLGVRAFRLVVRPLRNLGRTRQELPDGNVDWPLMQYRFAWKSLRRDRVFAGQIAQAVAPFPDVPVWRCAHHRDIDKVLALWAAPSAMATVSA